MSRSLIHLALFLVGGGMLVIGCAVTVINRDGSLTWDDSQYLERGFFHARQVKQKGYGVLTPARLVYSLRFESPKPPLLTAWIAAWQLLLDAPPLTVILVLSSTVPFALVLGLLWSMGIQLQDPLAGWCAVLAYASSFVALEWGQRVMVETFQALWMTAAVLACTFLVERPTRWRGGVLGLLVGLAFLTKISSIPFLVPALGLTVFFVVRQHSANSLASLVVAAATIGLVAGGWYAFNWIETWQHAAASARFDSRFVGYHAPLGWRGVDMIVDGVGSLGILAGAMLLFRKVRQEARGILEQAGPRRTFFRLGGVTAATAVVTTLVPSYFELRFILPVVGIVALMTGIWLSRVMEQSSWRVKALVLGSGLAALGVSGERVLALPVPPSHWEIVADLQTLTTEVQRPRTGIFGYTTEFNCYKLRLLNEMTHPGNRTTIVDLTPLTWEKLRDTAESCELLIVAENVCDPQMVLAEQALETEKHFREWLDGSSSPFRRLEEPPGRLGYAVYRRAR